VACASATVLGVVLSLMTRSPVTKGTDFFYYFCVSKLVAQGRGSHVYDPRALGLLERSLAHPVRVPGGLIPNVYPPFFAVALAPLANLPYSLAYVVWLLLNCILLGWSVFYLEQYAHFGRRGRAIFRLATFVSLPVIVGLLLGQVTFILLALLCSTFFAANSRMDRLAGVSLALTLIKPQYALPFLLIFVLHRRHQALIAFMATACALFVVPNLVLGWSADQAYIEALLHATRWGGEVGGFSPRVNRSFSGFTQLLMPTPASRVANAVLDVLALGAVIVTTVRTRELDLPFGLALVVALLASQHVLLHDLTLLIIPAAIAWRYRTVAPTSTLALGALVYLSMYMGFNASLTRSIQLPTIAMSALAVWLFVIAWRVSTNRPPYATLRARIEAPSITRDGR
jgi:Glycosyltransferase family 87